MRRASLLCASALLLAVTTVACGDDDSGDGGGTAGEPATGTSSATVTDEPTETEEPTEEPTETDEPTDTTDPDIAAFCTAATAEGFDEGGYAEIKSWATGLRQATPPSTLSTQEADGLELLLSMVEGANNQQELTAAGNNFTSEEQAQAQAFLTWVNTNCET